MEGDLYRYARSIASVPASLSNVTTEPVLIAILPGTHEI